ncbi:hypothetical protein [Streptomyces coelicoflavus]|uniref:hypothetical protein n=1 Tax=Streptomyces coelicoflavus TaxID=285562 RepID=UPI002E26EB82
MRDLVQRLEASDAPLLRQLFYALAVPAPDMRIHVHDNQFHGPTQMGGIQIVNMREAEHEPEL